MFSVLQISSMVLFLSSYKDCAIATFFGVLRVLALGLPPVRPLARAAITLARVLSRMIYRSNSANAPKI